MAEHRKRIAALPNSAVFGEPKGQRIPAAAAASPTKGTKASERRQYPSLQLYEHEIDS